MATGGTTEGLVIKFGYDLTSGMEQGVRDFYASLNRLERAARSKKIKVEWEFGDTHQAQFDRMNQKIEETNNLLKASDAMLAAVGGDVTKMSATTRASFDAINMQIQKNLKEIQAFSVSLENLPQHLGTSVNMMKQQLASLSARWDEMSVGEKFSGKGFSRMSAEAKKLLQDYIKLKSWIDKHGQGIDAVARKSRETALLRKKHLTTEAEYLEKIRILENRIANTPIGTAKYNKYKKDLAEVSAGLDAIRGKQSGVNTSLALTQAQMKRLNDSFRLADHYTGRLLVRLAAYAGVAMFARMLRNIKDITAEFELQKVALGAIIQDTDQASKLFAQIKAQAIRSPFEVKELVTYTKQLAAYRVESERLFDVTMQLADISSALGVDMQRLILAYGQVKAASVLRGQELRQFTEAGIPLVQKLADKFTELRGRVVSTGEVFDLISKRAVSFGMIEEIFNDMTDAGGEFYRMQEKQAETLKGRWTNLKDAISIAYDEIGRSKGVQNLMKGLINAVSSLAKNWRVWSSAIGITSKSLIILAIAAKNTKLAMSALTSTEVAQAIAEGKLQLNTIKTATATTALTNAEIRRNKHLIAANKHIIAAAMSNNVMSLSFHKVAAAIQTLWASIGPVGWIIAGLTALVGIVKKLSFSIQKVQGDIDALDKALAEKETMAKRQEETEKLISIYEELSQKTDKTAKETKKLTAVTRELARVFPSARNGSKNLSDGFDLDIQKVKGLNAELTKLKEQSDANALARAEKDLDKIEKKLSKFTRDSSGRIVYKASALKSSFIRRFTGKEEEEFNELLAARDDLIEKIDAYKHPKKAGSTEIVWTGWRKQILTFQKSIAGIERPIQAVYEDQIEGLSGLAEVWDNAAKTWKEQTEEIKRYKKTLAKSNLGDEERQQIEETMSYAEAVRDVNYELLAYYNQLDLLEDKKQSKKDMSALKEELKNVQDIYKKYVELRKVMSESDAKSEIEKIYGSVTKIDFLDPELYKIRLTKILSALKAFEREVANVAYDLDSDFYGAARQMLIGDEGFDEIANIKPGESRPTIGYGFYDRLISQDKEIVEGMKISREEAEKEIEAQIKTRLLAIKDMIAKFAPDMNVTKEQLLQLLNLSYQSGTGRIRDNVGEGGVAGLIYRTKGDLEAIKKELENFSFSRLNAAQKAAMGKGVKARDERRAQQWAKEIGSDTAKNALLVFDEIMENLDPEQTSAITELVNEAFKLVQDVDYTELENAIKKKLENLAKEIATANEASKFYEEIFGKTFNRSLSEALTASIYGADRTAATKALKDYVREVFGDVGMSAFDQAAGSFNWTYLEQLITEEMPEEIQKLAREIVDNGRKASMEQYKQWMNDLAKEKDVLDRRIDLHHQTVQRIREIESDANLLPSERNELISQYRKREQKLASDIAYQAFKESPAYVQLFANLDNASVSMLERLKSNIQTLQSEWSNLDPANLKELQSRIQEIDKVLVQKRPFEQLAKGLQEYYKNSTRRRSADKTALKSAAAASERQKLALEYAVRLEEEEQKLHDIQEGKVSASEEDLQAQRQLVEELTTQYGFYKKFYENAKNRADADAEDVDHWRRIREQIQSSINVIATYSDQLTTINDMVFRIGSAFNYADDVQKEFLNNMKDGIDDIIGGVGTLAKGVGEIYGGNKVQGVIDVIIGLERAVEGALNTVRAQELRDINREIKNQEEAIDNLEKAYSRLREAEEKAFGTEWIQNRQRELDILEAQAEAYRKKADAEMQKADKDRDEAQAREWYQKSEEIMDDIIEREKEISEHFLGTDMASAARDFASAWLDAYKSYGNTIDAMEQKFHDMMENMVKESIMARIMQPFIDKIMAPFDELDKDSNTNDILAALDRSLTIYQEGVGGVNDSLIAVTNVLRARGFDLRDTVSDMKGISKDIASASEQSIMGLAAGINTQNFYISGIYSSVNQILSVMTGSTSSSSPSRAGEFEVGSVDYTSHLQDIVAHTTSISQDISEIRTMLGRVISSSGSRTFVNVKM